MIFRLTGQMPSGKNQVGITRTGRRYPNKRFTLWREQALAQLDAPRYDYRQQGVCWPLETPIRLHCEYTPGDARTRDVPGILDALCHLIVKAGLLKDDGLVWDVEWNRKPIDRDKPGLIFMFEYKLRERMAP